MIYKDIKDFHTQNKYYVKVSPGKDGLSCAVKFPDNIIHDVVRNFSLLYEIEPENNILRKHLIIQKHVEKTELEVYKFMARVLVIQDILILTSALEISLELILIDNPEIKDLAEIFDLDLTLGEQNKERRLFGELGGVLTNRVKTSLLDDEDIGSCYQLMLDVFDRGGL
jgi:hypothetical protein